jgi:hypothetical protein
MRIPIDDRLDECWGKAFGLNKEELLVKSAKVTLPLVKSFPTIGSLDNLNFGDASKLVHVSGILNTSGS